MSIFIGKFITAVVISVLSLAISLPAVAAETQKIKNRYFLGIGIDKFKDGKLLVNEKTSNNAVNFADYLEARGGYEEKDIKVLSNEKATREVIQESLFKSWLPKVMGPDDLAVIYISTTIKAAKKDGEWYLAAYDSDSSSLSTSGILLSSLPQKIAKNIPGKFVLIIEGDNSGSVKLDPEIKSGAIVITSCAFDQTSFNEKNNEGSVFTNRLIDVIADGDFDDSISKVMKSVKQKVKAQVKKERGVSQIPQLKSNWKGAMPSIQPPVE